MIFMLSFTNNRYCGDKNNEKEIQSFTERPPPEMTSNNKLFHHIAFTLAEILITLTIIGVIAVLTIPNLIAKKERAEIPVKVKKAYSALYNSLSASQADNGSFSDWDYSTKITDAEWAERYLLPYLKVAKNCGTQQGCRANTYTQNSGTNAVVPYYYTPYYSFVLDDGTTVMLHNSGYASNPELNYYLIGVDINGMKAPNKAGYDLFFFVSIKNSNVVFEPYTWHYNPLSYSKCNHNELLNGINSYEGCARQGYACAALLMCDGWQMKDDYPIK